MATTFDLGGLLGSAFGGNEYGDLLTPEQQSAIQQRGLLSAAAALLQAGGPSTTRTSLGQALGAAFGAGQAGAEKAQQSALTGLLTRQKLEEARRAREVQENISKILGGGQQIAPTGQSITPEMALAAPVTEDMPAGPTMARAQMIGQAAPAAPAMSPNEMRAQQYRQVADVYAASGRAEDSKRFMDIAEQLAPTRQKVIGEPIQTRTGWIQRTESGGFIQLPKDFEPVVKVKPIGEPLTVMDQSSGKEILVQRYDDNTIKPLEGFGPKRDVVLQNVDGKVVAIDKSKVETGQEFGTGRNLQLVDVDGVKQLVDLNAAPVGTTFGTGMSPVDKARLDIENQQLALARERLQISKDEFNRGNYQRMETAAGIVYVPTTPGGKVIPLTDAAGKPLMGIEAQQLDIARRRLNISEAEFARGAYERTETANGIVYVSKVPGKPIIPITDASGKPLMGAGGKPTEGEANASGFAQRMERSLDVLSRLPADSQPGVRAAVAGALPIIGGVAQRRAMTTEQQQYKQAADDWIRAKLRKESGAAIGVDEMKKEYETYFPQIGDGPEVIAQKAQARAIATDAMKTSAGKAYRPYVPTGPKEGDTAKDRNNRDIIFRNGQWVYQ